jgi:hypothetical protein
MRKNDKTRVKKNGKIKYDKKSNQKRRKNNTTLSQKSEKGQKKFDKNAIKMKKAKIKILTHELLVFTLSYLKLVTW